MRKMKRKEELTFGIPSKILLKVPTPRPTDPVRELMIPWVTMEIASGSRFFASLESTVALEGR